MISFFGNLTIKQRLIGAFVFMIVIIVANSLFMLSSVQQTGQIVDKMHRHPLTVTRASGLAYAHILKIGQLIRDRRTAIEGKTSAENWSMLIEQQAVETKKHIDIINARILGTEGQQMAARATKEFFAWTDSAKSILDTAKVAPNEISRLLATEQSIARQFLDIVAYAENKGNGFYRSSEDKIDNTFNTIIALVVFMTLVSVFLAYFVIKNITTPLTYLRQTIEDIERESNLSGRVNFESRCEVGVIAKRFNDMMHKIEKLVVKGLQAAANLESANLAQTTQTNEMTQSIAVQTKEIEQVVSAISDMNQQIQTVAQSADETKTRVSQANDLAVDSNSTVHNMTADIESLASSADKTTELVTQLKSDADNIDNILEVIRSIAEQTNLLALNAAIEAARAGEQGRGFAVVADEVRTLAERTTQSTAEIQSTIENLQSGAKVMVDAIQSNTHMIGNCVEKAGLVNQQIEQISSLMGEVSNMNNMMAKGTSEQAIASQNVDSRMQTISSLAIKSETNVEELERHNKVSQKQSDSLSLAMKQFIVG